MHHTRSRKLFERAQRVLPGGVNSPVRAFRAVGSHPVFIARARGPYLWDVDGNRYIDYVGSWGPMVFGHADRAILAAVRETAKQGTSFGAPTELEVKIGELICAMVPSIEMVRMVNSGTEATMSAIRLARAFTGRDKIVKFEGCYHGHADAFLIKAGSGAMTLGTPDSPGVPRGVAADTLTARFNAIESVKTLVASNPRQIAAVIVEPVVGNMGCVPPQKGFLEALRSLCSAEGIVLIFDEVMTGFRLAPGGAQELFGIKPDLTTLGKIIGGGLPVGAYGGSRKIMELVSPSGPMYQAGTLSGNPIAMAAGFAALTRLHRNRTLYRTLEARGAELEEGLTKLAARSGIPCTVNRAGSMFTLFFSARPVTDYASAKDADTKRFASFFQECLHEGVYLPPSQFEAAFLSAAHTRPIIGRTLKAASRAFERLTALIL